MMEPTVSELLYRQAFIEGMRHACDCVGGGADDAICEEIDRKRREWKLEGMGDDEDDNSGDE